jgi:Ca2+-binding RTX toxin-like protein
MQTIFISGINDDDSFNPIDYFLEKGHPDVDYNGGPQKYFDTIDFSNASKIYFDLNNPIINFNLPFYKDQEFDNPNEIWYFKQSEGVTEYVNLANQIEYYSFRDIESIIGSPGNDVIIGTDNGIFFNVGNGGNDTVIGSTGRDTVSFEWSEFLNNSGSGVNINLGYSINESQPGAILYYDDGTKSYSYSFIKS